MKNFVKLLRLLIFLPLLSVWVSSPVQSSGMPRPLFLKKDKTHGLTWHPETESITVLPMQLTGIVIHVEDGDTLTIQDQNKRTWIIRMSDIDAPEIRHSKNRPGQAYSGRAKEYLSSLVAGKITINDCYDVDHKVNGNGASRDRYICHVFVGTKNINLMMIEAGMAFANRQKPEYVRNPQAYILEDQARQKKRGLWANPPDRPWQWRKEKWDTSP